MGGIWLPASWAPNPTPFVWRSPFRPDVTANVVSDANPLGQLNNSILELTGTLAHDATLLQAPSHCRAISTSTGSDNSAAIGWLAKASVTTDRPIAPSPPYFISAPVSIMPIAFGQPTIMYQEKPIV